MQPLDEGVIQEELGRGRSISDLSRSWGIPRTTLRDFVARHNLKPTAAAPTVVVKPTYRIAQSNSNGTERLEVLAIGDAHDSPHIPDKSRFEWFGRYAAEHRVDRVLSIGDIASLDSLCSYERNDSHRGKTKPTFKEDMASFKLAMESWRRGLSGYEVDCHVTLGNHEDRISSFSNRTPEIYGMLDENLFTILSDNGWTYSPFGSMHYIGGVAFTHAPLNVMGKPFGGENSENQIGNKSTTDIVYGHTHKHGEKSFWKVGGHKVKVLNLGCALPEGYTEDYAKHSLGSGNWDWGVYHLTIQHGRIQKAHWIPMAELRERYG